MKKWINNIVQACYRWVKASGVIVLVMCMVSCNANVSNQGIVTIEGCEYIQNSGTLLNNYNLTHKGNCNNSIHQQVIHDTVYIPVPSESHSQIK